MEQPRAKGELYYNEGPWINAADHSYFLGGKKCIQKGPDPKPFMLDCAGLKQEVPTGIITYNFYLGSLPKTPLSDPKLPGLFPTVFAEGAASC